MLLKRNYLGTCKFWLFLKGIFLTLPLSLLGFHVKNDVILELTQN